MPIKSTNNKGHNKTKSKLVITIVGFHAVALACHTGPSKNMTESDSRTQSLDQYVAGTGTYQCSGSHLDPSKRYTDGTSFGKLSVEVPNNLAPTLKKSFGAIPVEIGKTLELFQTKVKVTSEAKSICATALAGSSWASVGDQKSCWVSDQNGLTLYFDADPKVLAESVVRTFTYAFSEYFVTELSKVSQDVEVQKFAANWVKNQADLAQAVVSDVRSSKLVSNEKLETLLQKPTFSHDVTADAFDSYYCSKESQVAMAEKFPRTWKVFTGS